MSVSETPFKVGDRFSNAIEVSDKAITIEIKSVWFDGDNEDPEDNGYYYIVKCLEVAPHRDDNTWGYSHSAWMFKEEIKLLHHFNIYKYYREVV